MLFSSITDKSPLPAKLRLDKKGLDAAALAEAQVLMEARMKNLFETARLALVRS